MKTMINIKTDVELKKEVQEVANDLGLPLGTIINHYLRELVNERRVVFADHPMPNPKTQKIINRALQDVKEGKNITASFDTAKDAASYLRSL
jgi:addiction module RelB/DinJ family antitoxin